MLLRHLLVLHHCHRSAGKKVDFDGEEHTIQELTEDRWGKSKQQQANHDMSYISLLYLRISMVLI